MNVVYYIITPSGRQRVKERTPCFVFSFFCVTIFREHAHFWCFQHVSLWRRKIKASEDLLWCKDKQILTTFMNLNLFNTRELRLSFYQVTLFVLWAACWRSWTPEKFDIFAPPREETAGRLVFLIWVLYSCIIFMEEPARISSVLLKPKTAK